MIKAIDTVYRGFKFRSRLEARWAVFFDAIGHEWTYEPEGFELPSGWYLPDFLIKKFDVYVEIKPKAPDDRERQIGEDMAAAGKQFVLFYGDDPADVFSRWTWPGKSPDPKDPRTWNFEGVKSPGMWLPEHVPARLAFFICTFCYSHKRTFAASVAARQARFERGA